jgi:hypothetical protein
MDVKVIGKCAKLGVVFIILSATEFQFLSLNTILKI